MQQLVDTRRVALEAVCFTANAAVGGFEYTPLGLAVAWRHTDIARVLIRAGVSPATPFTINGKQVTPQQYTPALFAA